MYEKAGPTLGNGGERWRSHQSIYKNGANDSKYHDKAG